MVSRRCIHLGMLKLHGNETILLLLTLLVSNLEMCDLITLGPCQPDALEY